MLAEMLNSVRQASGNRPPFGMSGQMRTDYNEAKADINMRHHMKRILWIGLLIVIASLTTSIIMAQDDANTEDLPPIPVAYQLAGVRHEYQGWNNCGPATLTNALTFFGYSENQTRAATWLKPHYEDKNVSPWQMAEFVNTQVPELPVYALARMGGDMELVKRLIANNFPVIIEAGYDPEPDRLGWMGHYLLISGYDDSVGVFTTQDSYLGPNYNYGYNEIQTFWQHFNYTYIVLYTSDRLEELNAILGDDADEWQNAVNALELARAEATEDPSDKFAWFNMGTNFVELGMYEEASIAYDQARNLQLPWRMMWYQFGPFEAYYNVGRYDDMMVLVRANQNDGGGHFVEETRYYLGLAREGRGEIEMALENYNAALQFNPNFAPALEARNRLLSQ